MKGVKGNAAAAGISVGDTIVYTSSFFGDELWPSDNLAFTRSALANAPSPVCIEFVKGENSSVNVKRLPKKPAPQRFGRKLTAAQKALATHICVDCGYIYADRTPFSETGGDYRCPQVSKRLERKDKGGGKGRKKRFLSLLARAHLSLPLSLSRALFKKKKLKKPHKKQKHSATPPRSASRCTTPRRARPREATRARWPRRRR